MYMAYMKKKTKRSKQKARKTKRISGGHQRDLQTANRTAKEEQWYETT